MTSAIFQKNSHELRFRYEGYCGPHTMKTGCFNVEWDSLPRNYADAEYNTIEQGALIECDQMA